MNVTARFRVSTKRSSLLGSAHAVDARSGNSERRAQDRQAR
ncbi:MAG TPA: hypothetical protein VG734_01845 [Lacunisphaera sp.]|nr:hypothetical protein [Lacunisphaera sp.]